MYLYRVKGRKRPFDTSDFLVDKKVSGCRCKKRYDFYFSVRRGPRRQAKINDINNVSKDLCFIDRLIVWYLMIT